MRLLDRFALAMALLAMPATGAVAETPVERGRYLVTTIAACGNCHTPRDATKKPVARGELSGGFEFEDPGLGQIVGTNITPDAETGIGQWSEAEIVTALRDGKRPDGTLIRPPMPIPVYRQLSDNDAAAIAAYLKSVKPVRNKVGKAHYGVPLPPSYGAPIVRVPEPSRAVRSLTARTCPGRSGIASC